MGRIGQLRRRGAWRRDQRAAGAAAAGIGAEAVHLRARVRTGTEPASVLPDIPSHFPTAEPGVLYSPRNYDGQYRGPMLARRALAGSQNVPAVALASDVGVEHAAAFPRRAPASPRSTARRRTTASASRSGNAEVRLDELVAAYAAFARGGVWTRADAIRFR